MRLTTTIPTAVLTAVLASNVHADTLRPGLPVPFSPAFPGHDKRVDTAEKIWEALQRGNNNDSDWQDPDDEDTRAQLARGDAYFHISEAESLVNNCSPEGFQMEKEWLKRYMEGDNQAVSEVHELAQSGKVLDHLRFLVRDEKTYGEYIDQHCRDHCLDGKWESVPEILNKILTQYTKKLENIWENDTMSILEYLNPVKYRINGVLNDYNTVPEGVSKNCPNQ